MLGLTAANNTSLLQRVILSFGWDRIDLIWSVARFLRSRHSADVAMQVFIYIPGIKNMQHVHMFGFRLDQVLKFILTTPVQVSNISRLSPHARLSLTHELQLCCQALFRVC